MKNTFILSLFLLFTSFAHGQVSEKTFSQIDEKILALREQYKAVGLSVAIIKDNQVIYAKGFGYRDLDSKLPVDENTVFHIASMSKAFTGALLGLEQSEGHLSLDDKPGRYIPDFNFYNQKMDNLITIGDLLSHRSGIGSHGFSIVLFPEMDKTKTVQRLKYLKPQGAINNSFVYSNLGYTLAGAVVEQVTNKSWEDNLKERIFDPLGMNLSFTNTEKMISTGNYAKGYAMYKGEVVSVPFEKYYSFAPAGAIKSSLSDVSKWAIAWMNKGVYQGKQIIPEEYVRAATSIQNVKNDVYENDAFLMSEGYGWRLRSYNGYFRTRHGGNTNGFSTLMDLFPLDGLGIIVLTNQKGSYLPYAISEFISRKFLGLPEFEFPFIVGDTYQSEVMDAPYNNEKMPINADEEFLGKYAAKGYGAFEVTKEDGKLFIYFPTYKFQLVHTNYNFFYMNGTKDFDGDFDPGFTLEFVNNRDGEIESVKFYAQNEPIEFLKEVK